VTGPKRIHLSQSREKVRRGHQSRGWPGRSWFSSALWPSGIGQNLPLSDSHNSPGGGCTSRDREPTGMSATERPRDGLAACLWRYTHLPANPRLDSIRSVPTDKPRHGHLPPETRFKAIPGSLGRRRPVGSRSQAGDTHITALRLVDSTCVERSVLGSLTCSRPAF